MWRLIFHWLVAKPLMTFVLGLDVRDRDRLPRHGPAIVVANHNSHVDTVALLSLFPTGVVRTVRPVAAADYFLRNRALSWFSRRCLGILPFDRHALRDGGDPLVDCVAALDRGEILILFPEGSRGEPEQRQPFRKGICHLARRRPSVPIVPVHLHGCGRVLPKGSVLPVPMRCTALVGTPMTAPTGDATRFVDELETAMTRLAEGTTFPELESPRATDRSAESVPGSRRPRRRRAR
jgi:1-acyl-sn-glycerol-3-phosphate acyltransferase